MFCGKCGNKNPDENKFCAGCGTSLQTIQDSVEETRNEIVEKVETLQNEEKLKNLEEAKEKVYYRGEGELIVRTTKHHGTGRKVASFVAGAGVGYLIAGRDSKDGKVELINRANLMIFIIILSNMKMLI